MIEELPLQVVFTCVSNRVRSVFAEYFFADLLARKDAKYHRRIRTLSAGFVPKRLRDKLVSAGVVFPQPFYNRPMAEATRTVLFGKGIRVREGWRSKELSHELVKNADLIISVAIHQKEELVKIFPDAAGKIHTIREIAEWDGYIIFEDWAPVPLDRTFLQFCEEDFEYVSKVLSAMERLLMRAYPNILGRMDITVQKTG